MFTYDRHIQLKKLFEKNKLCTEKKDAMLYARFEANIAGIYERFMQLYDTHPHAAANFEKLLQVIINAYTNRATALKQRDEEKEKQDGWFLSNQITGMSLYTDRFAGNLKSMPSKLDYLQQLGVNFLHLMPIFESPEGESDGGYAVSDFRKVDKRFGTLQDLQQLQQSMQQRNMYLMLDIVLNHTSHKHEWALKAKQGDTEYQDYFYFYNNRDLPNQFEQNMPEIFPETAPGSFTYVEELNKWVMTVFHNYQWDLNYTNPAVLVAMIDTIFFYANLGVDVLRIDAPAFIWKQLGTSCQNLPQAHTLLQIIKHCVQTATPGMALLGEAIVAPAAIIKYFGSGNRIANECDVAYNATHMALQWDALATGDVKVMMAAQQILLQKPYGTTWLTYTRCHDDIGLGYDDYMIEQAGYNAYEHRKYLKEFYSGAHPQSPARGALFSVNPKTQDARISGSLASLCGLEKALEINNSADIDVSVNKIILMQAHSFFLGGIPMLFYGDEAAYTNDYSYLNDTGKSYDNRWMHRPVIDWNKNKRTQQEDTIEHRIFSATQQLIQLRRKLPAIADHKNLQWATPHNTHVAMYLRSTATQKIYCVFNFSHEAAYLTWYAFKENTHPAHTLYDHWKGTTYYVGADHEYLIIPPYKFYILEVVE